MHSELGITRPEKARYPQGCPQVVDNFGEQGVKRRQTDCHLPGMTTTPKHAQASAELSSHHQIALQMVIYLTRV